MAYSRQQRRIINAIDREADRRRAPRKYRIAAYMVGRVETNFSNPGMASSDRDSAGWRQERSHYGPESKRRNIHGAARRLFDEFEQFDRPGMSPGELAQAVQRSAFPGRYREHRGEAKRLARSSLSDSRAGANSTFSRTTRRIPGIDNSDLRQQLKMEYVLNRDRSDPLDLKLALEEAADVPGSVTTTRTRGGQGGPPMGQGQRIRRDGWKGSKSAGGPLASLAKRHGLTVTSTKRETQSTASGGTSDHWSGNKDSFAWDLAGSVGDMDRAAKKIARKLGVKNWKGGVLNVNRTIDGRQYRFQVLYRTNVGGNHYDHIHVGIDRLDTAG